MRKCDSIKIGDRYGRLIVLEEDLEKKAELLERYPQKKYVKFFKCLCDCGNITTVVGYNLLNGRTRSCGCLKLESQQGRHVQDLTGMKFGAMTVLYQDMTKPQGSGKHAYWICKCELCGNTKSCRSSDLIDGRVVDCGCQHWKRLSDGCSKDLTGQVFGHLHVIERDYTNVENSGGGRHAFWLCECDLCGRKELVSSDLLTVYGKDRCKRCSNISMGELKIIEILEENNIAFVHDKTYMNVKSPDGGGSLRFDFRINQHSECDYIIEFDGEQHFKLVPQYDNALSFERRQLRDNYKNQWCHENSIPIIRIPYTRLKKLNIDDLRLETSKYIVNQFEPPQGGSFNIQENRNDIVV